MAQNNYNVGSDAKVTLLSNGAPIGAAIVTSFQSKQETTKLKSTGIDGIVRNRHLEAGWSGTFKFDRGSSILDDFFSLKEEGRFAGLPPPVVTIFESVTNPSDGSTQKYRYDGVSMTLDDAGEKGGDKKVEQSVSWDASRRIKVA